MRLGEGTRSAIAGCGKWHPQGPAGPVDGGRCRDAWERRKDTLRSASYGCKTRVAPAATGQMRCPPWGRSSRPPTGGKAPVGRAHAIFQRTIFFLEEFWVHGNIGGTAECSSKFPVRPAHPASPPSTSRTSRCRVSVHTPPPLPRP